MNHSRNNFYVQQHNTEIENFDYKNFYDELRRQNSWAKGSKYSQNSQNNHSSNNSFNNNLSVNQELQSF